MFHPGISFAQMGTLSVPILVAPYSDQASQFCGSPSPESVRYQMHRLNPMALNQASQDGSPVIRPICASIYLSLEWDIHRFRTGCQSPMTHIVSITRLYQQVCPVLLVDTLARSSIGPLR